MAEVLGWEQTGTWFLDEPEWCAEVPVWQRPESPVVTVRGPSVDDMLTWLHKRGLFVEVMTTPLTDRCERAVDVVVSNAGLNSAARVAAPTLHAALSAAVLAVAEREEPGDE